jgi:hypothetical protein
MNKVSIHLVRQAPSECSNRGSTLRSALFNDSRQLRAALTVSGLGLFRRAHGKGPVCCMLCGVLLAFKKAYTTGSSTSVRAVELTSPPITTIARGRWISDPGPVAKQERYEAKRRDSRRHHHRPEPQLVLPAQHPSVTFRVPAACGYTTAAPHRSVRRSPTRQ